MAVLFERYITTFAGLPSETVDRTLPRLDEPALRAPEVLHALHGTKLFCQVRQNLRSPNSMIENELMPLLP